MAESKMYDAGFVQRREWMLHKIRSDGYPFSITIDFEINSFNPVFVNEAIKLIMQRHEILRTTLSVSGNGLRQIVHPAENYPVNLFFFSRNDQKEQPGFIRETVAWYEDVPFDFETGPLFRILIFELTGSRYEVYLIFHHIIVDQHSLQLFVKELIEMDKMMGGSPALSGNDTQYSEYAQFENELLETPKGDKYRKYWEGALKDGLPELGIVDKGRRRSYQLRHLEKVRTVRDKLCQLPYFDERFIGSVVRRFREEDGGMIKFKFDQGIFEKIQAYQETGVHGVMALVIGSLMLAFHRSGGQTKFVFDIPGSSRFDRKFDRTMGWLTSGGPGYFDIAQNLLPEPLLEYVDQQLYFLSRNCIYPFEAIGYRETPPLGSHIPAFFTLTYLNEDNMEEAGMIFRATAGHDCYQDMSFFFTLFNNALVLEIIYDNSLLDADTVESLIGNQVSALEYILQKDNT